MGDFETVKIRWGETLSKIAKEHGTTVKELQKLNNIKNANKIIAGETIKIPNKMGTTVEHTETKPQDEETRKARELANQEKIKEMNEIKNSQKENTKVAHGTNKTNASLVKTIYLVNDEMKIKKAPAEGGKKFGKNFGSAQYWSDLVDKISSDFDFPKEIIIAKISKEVTFQKEKVTYRKLKDKKTGKTVVISDQHGCMQIRNTAVRAMFPGAPGNWSEKYKELDEKLFNDIMYKKDDKGNLIPKYSSWNELLKDCKNDEISLKVGVLYDKMQMAEALTAEKYGPRRVFNNLSKTIAELKEKTNISPKENLNNIRKMETRYNGSPNYGKAITDSIVRMGMDLSEPIIKRT